MSAPQSAASPTTFATDEPPSSSRFLLITHDDIVVLKPDVMPEGNSGRLRLINNIVAGALDRNRICHIVRTLESPAAIKDLRRFGHPNGEFN